MVRVPQTGAVGASSADNRLYTGEFAARISGARNVRKSLDTGLKREGATRSGKRDRPVLRRLGGEW